MENKKILFRASGVGALMVGGNEISEKQLLEIGELISREEGLAIGKSGKPLSFTATMKEKLEKLEKQRDAPFEFGDTAKKFIEAKWMQDKFDYREEVVNDVLLKGNMCEQDSIGLVADVLPETVFRSKNTMYYTNDYFKGTPDVILDFDEYRIVEDVKTTWSVKTFFYKNKVEDIYFAQGQVYMDLTKCKKFRLHYCLVRTPEELIRNQCKRFFFKYGQDEDNPHYIAACEQIRMNNDLSLKDGTPIPQEDRVRTFEFDYDEDYMKKLKNRVVLAREYYNTLSL